MRVEILAVRHAAPVEGGLCYGQCDVAVALGPDATAAAILAVLHEAGFWPDRVWSSPSARCAEPAERVARQLGLDVAIDDRLIELHFGDWEGRAWKEIERVDASTLDRWMRSWETEAPPGGEMVAQLTARVRGWHDGLGPGRHLLIGHAGAVRALRVIVGSEDWPAAMRREVGHIAGELFRSSAS